MSSRRGFVAFVALVLLPVVLAGTAMANVVAVGQTQGTVFIQTVPALGGVNVRVGPVTVTTGRDGTAMVGLADINRIAARVSLAGSVLDSRNTLSLAYVKPAPHSAKHESRLIIGLAVTSTVTLRISGGTTGVVPSQVHAVRLHSAIGQTIVVDPQRTLTINLLSRRPRFVAGVVVPQVVTWSVDSLRATPGVSITTLRASFDPFSSPVWPLILRPVTGTVVVDTVPATPGVSFLLEGATFTTNAKGQGTSPVADLNGVDLRLRVSTPQAAGSTVSILSVSRLKPSAAFQRHLVVALAVSRPVSLSFKDPAGRAVSAERVGEVRLTGDGRTVSVSGAQLQDTVSLLSDQAKLVDDTWTAQQVTYSVSSVSVEGSDAVFAGQQRFNPNTASHWPISVSVFDLGVTVRDVLFGRGVSSAAEVIRPDGKRYAVQLGGQGSTLLRSLVRGEYTVTTQSAVLGGTSKILVSKNYDVNLQVVTLPDLVVLLLLMIGVSVSVVMLGRRTIRGSSSRRAGGQP
jgi:hypothetical protein